MSFWKDATPVVKGAILFGALALALLVGLMLTDESSRSIGSSRGIEGGAEGAEP